MRRKEGDKATEILNASIHVFAREGFDKSQVSAIAQEAGVGTGSIYLYFTGKDDILHGLFARFWESLAIDMKGLTQPDPLFRMNDQLGLFFDRLVEDRDLARIYLREHHRFVESPAAKGLSWHRTCLELGRAAFAEIVLAGGKQRPPPETLDLAQAFLFGGVRAALEFGLECAIDPVEVKRHMQTMAMASILAAIEEVPS